MSVHYKFKSNLDHDTVTFDGLSISVADLKKSIMQQKKIGKSFDFDLQITNAQTKEVYDSEEMLVPKNTSVIVARVPVAAGNKKNWDNKPDLPLPIDDDDLGHIRYDRIVKNADLANANTTEEDKVKAMITQSSQEYDPSKYVKSRSMTGPLPPTYMCFRCGKQGHWIKNCPTNNPDVKHSTGIPRSFMVPVDGPEHKGALLTSSGDYAVPLIDHQAYKEVKKEKPPFVPQDEPVAEPEAQIPEELLCMVCKDLLQDAVLIPCCGNSFCDECVRQVLLESDNHECPECHETEVSPNTLIPNRFLRTAVLNFKNETGYTRVKKISLIKSSPVCIENVESPQPSPDSTVENQPTQQLENSSSQNDKPKVEEKLVSLKLEDSPAPEVKIEADPVAVNESSQPPVSPKPSLDEDSQDVQPGTPLADEPPVDLEQPSLPIQAIGQEQYHSERYDYHSGPRYSRNYRDDYQDHYSEETADSSEPKPISTIETTMTMRKSKYTRVGLAPVRQQFPNQRPHREDRPDSYNRDRDDYPCHYDRRHADRTSQRPGHHSRYNRSPQSRYHNDDYHHNDNNQNHGYDVEYDNHSRGEEPVRRHADRYRIPAHPVPIPPVVPVYPVASLPVAPPILPTPQVFTPQPQPPPPGASPVDTSHIAAQPPPPGVGPLLPPNVSSDPPAPFNKPPLYETEDPHKDAKKVDDRSIDDKIEAFQRELEKRDRGFSRDRGSRSRSRSSDRDRTRSSSRSRSYSSSKSWSRSPSRSSSRSSRSRSRTPLSSRSRSRSYSPSRSRSWSKTRSYTRSRSRTRTTESSRSRSRSRAEPRFRRRVESRERIHSPRPRSRSRSYSPKSFRHIPHRNIPYVGGRHYTPPQYGTSYQSQYGPPPAVSIPVLRPDYPPHHIQHSIHPVIRQIEHYPIDRQPKCIPPYPEVYPVYNTYQQHPRYEREQRPARFDKRPDYQRQQNPEIVGHRIPGYIGDRSRGYKQKYRQIREPRKEIIRELPHVSEQEIRVVHTKESAEEPPSKKKEEKTVAKHKKHHHHHKSKESKKQESKIPVVIGIEKQNETSKNLIKMEVQSDRVVENKSNSENCAKVVKNPEKVKDKKHKHRKHKTGEQTVKKKKSVKREKSENSQTTDCDVHVKVKNRKKKKLKTIVEETAETEEKVESATPAVDPKLESEDVSDKKPLEENHTKSHDTSADTLDIFADEGEAAMLSEAVPETDSNEIEENIPVENEENAIEHVEEEIEEENINTGDEVEENAEDEGLHVDVPALSKWEREEFEDDVESRPQRKSTIVIPKEEKESLSSDIIHRAELAILSKPLKPQITSKDKCDSKDSSAASSPDILSQHKEPELKSVVHTERLSSPALQVTISTIKEKRSVHKKDDKSSKELSQSQQTKRIKLDRSNYGSEIEKPSSHRIISTSSSKGADRGRDIRDRNADRDRRRSPIRDLGSKLRMSHDSRDRREREIGNRRIERDRYNDERLREQRRHRFAEDRNIHSSREFSGSREVSRTDKRRPLNEPPQPSRSIRHFDRDNIQVPDKSRRPRTGRRSRSRSNDSSESHNSLKKKQPVCVRVDKIEEHRRSTKDHSQNDSNENRPRFKHSPIKAPEKHSTESKKVKKDFHDDLKFEPDYDAFSDVEEKESRERLKRKSNSPETSKKRIRLGKRLELTGKDLQRIDKSSITSSASSSANSDSDSSDSSNQKGLKGRISDSDHKQKHKKTKHKKHKKHKHKHKKKKSHKSKRN